MVLFGNNKVEIKKESYWGFEPLNINVLKEVYPLAILEKIATSINTESNNEVFGRVRTSFINSNGNTLFELQISSRNESFSILDVWGNYSDFFSELSVRSWLGDRNNEDEVVTLLKDPSLLETHIKTLLIENSAKIKLITDKIMFRNHFRL